MSLRIARLLAAAWCAATMTAQQLPSPSAELNRQLPQWLRFGVDYRARIEGFWNGGFKDNNEDAYLLNRFRVNMLIQPNDWLKFVFQGQDARVFWNDKIPHAPPYQDSMDLRLGYVELGDPDKEPVSLRAGRQELVFGEQRLVGHTSWANTARSFDAVRATFRSNSGYRLDAFASSVVVLTDGEFGKPIAGNNLHGLYGGIEKLVPDAVIEPYVLWRLAPRLASEYGPVGNLDSKTVGVRWAGRLAGGFDYGTEMAFQTGSLGSDKVRAWAGHWVAGRTLRRVKWTPRVSAEYNYATGDKDPRDGRRGTFDQLYPTNHDKYGLTDQMGWRNMRDLRFGLDLKPRSKWLIVVNWHDWWLASARDALYNSAGNPIARVADGSGGTHVGQEAGVQAIYTLSPQMQIGAAVGHVFPGEFLKKATPGKGYTIPYLVIGYSF